MNNNRKCQKERNEKIYSCPKTSCPNHGICCNCVLKHKITDSLQFCLFENNEGDKSVKNYYRKLKEKFNNEDRK